MDFSYPSVILIFGIAVAGLALFGAIAVGPYGRRGVRIMLVTIFFVALLGSAFSLTIFLGLLEERRSIETRLSELKGQALSAGSPLACLERTGSTVEAACAQKLFSTPEALAAANLYTAERLDLLTSAARYPGPRTPQFDSAVDALRMSLQQDPLGLTSHVLMLRRGCTPERCEELAMFQDPQRLKNNIRQRAFDANVARHAGSWRAPPPTGPLQGTTSSAPPSIAPADPETRAPIPEKYTLPSAASIPPVSIMNEEPATRSDPVGPSVKDRSNATRQPAAASSREEQATAPASLPSMSSSEKQMPPRREKMRPGAPLSIAPQQK